MNVRACNAWSLLSNRQVVCSRSATRSAGSAESPLVLLTNPSTWIQQQPVRFLALCPREAVAPAPRAIEVWLKLQASILDRSLPLILPSGCVVVHLEEARLLGRSGRDGGYFVLLGGHVLGVLLVGQTVGGQHHGQEVCRSNDAVGKIRGRCGWRRQRELSRGRSLSRRSCFPCQKEPPATWSVRPLLSYI